jgi:hypothetical protein
MAQLRRNVVIYVKHVTCRENFVMFINCVSVIHLIVVRYLFVNKQFLKSLNLVMALGSGYTVLQVQWQMTHKRNRGIGYSC